MLRKTQQGKEGERMEGSVRCGDGGVSLINQYLSRDLIRIRELSRERRCIICSLRFLKVGFTAQKEVCLGERSLGGLRRRCISAAGEGSGLQMPIISSWLMTVWGSTPLASDSVIPAPRVRYGSLCLCVSYETVGSVREGPFWVSYESQLLQPRAWYLALLSVGTAEPHD